MTARFTAEEPPPHRSGGGPGVRVLVVRGEVDTTNAAQFEGRVAEHCTPEGLVLDLSAITYCDSAAFAALDRILAKGDVAVALAPGNPVRRAAAIMGLAVFDSVEDASRSLAG